MVSGNLLHFVLLCHCPAMKPLAAKLGRDSSEWLQEGTEVKPSSWCGGGNVQNCQIHFDYLNDIFFEANHLLSCVRNHGCSVTTCPRQPTTISWTFFVQHLQDWHNLMVDQHWSCWSYQFYLKLASSLPSQSCRWLPGTLADGVLESCSCHLFKLVHRTLWSWDLSCWGSISFQFASICFHILTFCT